MYYRARTEIPATRYVRTRQPHSVHYGPTRVETITLPPGDLIELIQADYVPPADTTDQPTDHAQRIEILAQPSDADTRVVIPLRCTVANGDLEPVAPTEVWQRLLGWALNGPAAAANLRRAAAAAEDGTVVVEVVDEAAEIFRRHPIQLGPIGQGGKTNVLAGLLSEQSIRSAMGVDDWDPEHREYQVTWEMDVSARSPEEAAARALAAQRRSHSTATTFAVEWTDTAGDAYGTETTSHREIDLGEDSTAVGTRVELPDGRTGTVLWSAELNTSGEDQWFVIPDDAGRMAILPAADLHVLDDPDNGTRGPLGATGDPSPYDPQTPVIGRVEKSAAGNTVMEIGRMNPDRAAWTKEIHLVLTPTEREHLIQRLIAQRDS